MAVRVTKGIRRLLDHDPAQRLLGYVELAQEDMDLRVLKRVLTNIVPRIEKGWIHVSDLQLPCDRLIAASLLGIKPPGGSRSRVSQRVLDNGTFMHLRFQTYFSCLPKPFEVQAPRLLRYWPLIGEADITVHHPELGNWVIELKSIHNSGWRSLSTPKSVHVLQLNSYLGLLGVIWQGQFWYENKNTQELKVFTHSLDGNVWKEMWVRASTIALRVLEGYLPGTCSDCVDPVFCENVKLKESSLEAIYEQRTAYPRVFR